MKWMLAVVVILLYIGLAHGQGGSATGQCSETMIQLYVGLSLGLECAGNFNDFYDEPGPFTDEGADALQDGCSDPGCAAQFYTWLLDFCKDEFQADGIALICSYNGNTSCYYYIPEALPFFDENAYANLNTSITQCQNPELNDTCPIACSNAVQELAGVMGCCFGTVYGPDRQPERPFLTDFYRECGLGEPPASCTFPFSDNTNNNTNNTTMEPDNGTGAATAVVGNFEIILFILGLLSFGAIY